MTRRQIRHIARLVTWPDNAALAVDHAAPITCHERRIELPHPPIAPMSRIETLMQSWWQHASAYPVGRRFGTLTA